MKKTFQKKQLLAGLLLLFLWLFFYFPPINIFIIVIFLGLFSSIVGLIFSFFLPKKTVFVLSLFIFVALLLKVLMVMDWINLLILFSLTITLLVFLREK